MASAVACSPLTRYLQRHTPGYSISPRHHVNCLLCCRHLHCKSQSYGVATNGAQIKDKCVICPAHKTAFDLKTGQVKGEWCPSFPSLPVVGKMSSATPLPTYQARVDEAGNVEVLC